MRVVVCTIVHHPADARIYHRQIRALLDAGHEVRYIAPVGPQDFESERAGLSLQLTALPGWAGFIKWREEQQDYSWQEAYPDLKVEILEAEGNGEQVFLWVRFSGHGAASGIPLQMDLAHVYTLRDGKAACVVEYMDREEALRAAGLSE